MKAFVMRSVCCSNFSASLTLWLVSLVIKGALMDLIDNFALVDGPYNGPLFCQWRGKRAAQPSWWGVQPDLTEAFITRFTFHTRTIMAHTSAIMSKAQYSEWGW